jgi:hypothetical protein
MEKIEIKGLELAERFYTEAVKPMLKERFPTLYDRAAAGLVGHGSECYGYDDVYSADHDYGAGVCIWLAKEDFERYGAAVQAEISALRLSSPGRTRSSSGSKPRRASR